MKRIDGIKYTPDIMPPQGAQLMAKLTEEEIEKLEKLIKVTKPDFSFDNETVLVVGRKNFARIFPIYAKVYKVRRNQCYVLRRYENGVFLTGALDNKMRFLPFCVKRNVQ